MFCVSVFVLGFEFDLLWFSNELTGFLCSSSVKKIEKKRKKRMVHLWFMHGMEMEGKAKSFL